MTLPAFAKVNLTLEVLGRRTDGYHDLRSVVLPVSLADTLSVTAADELSSDTGYPNDLCLKAARALCPNRGAEIRVEKRIPAGGGLGGGSADAAATLRALNELWGLGKTLGELAEIATRVGSDVPALVLGGPVLMEGRGERVTRLPLRQAPDLNLVLVNPGVPSSTPAVYAALRDGETGTRDAPTSRLIAALAENDFDALVSALTNDLQAPAVRLHPEIACAMDALRRAGAEGVLMSGSGSTVFGLARTAEAARTLADRVARQALTDGRNALWTVHTAHAIATEAQNMV